MPNDSGTVVMYTARRGGTLVEGVNKKKHWSSSRRSLADYREIPRRQICSCNLRT
ncbi:hypothetical protein PISMIDRAFT_680575 [Pisolithus microcarpus 441]|uniref:Unplaced genomic scaffold scaffold_58, whole genome shotgun sequence n=1 Tax=Pisolithus microcarpus 441 TaxID=765257 RepID=A0A0C9YZM5_9AGAM|nr:hypothetical protein PISMIDRAFT_680575 [Pisolithus microcarpus 441]